MNTNVEGQYSVQNDTYRKKGHCLEEPESCVVRRREAPMPKEQTVCKGMSRDHHHRAETSRDCWTYRP